MAPALAHHTPQRSPKQGPSYSPGGRPTTQPGLDPSCNSAGSTTRPGPKLVLSLIAPEAGPPHNLDWTPAVNSAWSKPRPQPWAHPIYQPGPLPIPPHNKGTQTHPNQNRGTHQIRIHKTPTQHNRTLPGGGGQKWQELSNPNFHMGLSATETTTNPRRTPATCARPNPSLCADSALGGGDAKGRVNG